MTVHLHDSVVVDRPATEVAARLVLEGAALAGAATEAARHATATVRDRAGFRGRDVAPTVEVRRPTEHELGVVVVTWETDERASGWPRMALWLVPSAQPDGTTRLGILSPRHPGYDRSAGDIDKVWRDRAARTAVTSFLLALGRTLESPVAAPEPVTAAVPNRDAAPVAV
jgi:hypothetical protein